MIIERRIASRHPALRYAQVQSLGLMLDEAVKACTTPDIVRIVPRRIPHASRFLNACHAAFVDHQFAGGTGSEPALRPDGRDGPRLETASNLGNESRASDSRIRIRCRRRVRGGTAAQRMVSYCTPKRRGMRGTKPNPVARARLTNTQFTKTAAGELYDLAYGAFQSMASNAPCTGLTPSDCSVTVIGSTTAAADGNVSRIPLPGGVNSMIIGIGVFFPNKRSTQRVGIIPDIEVKPTLAGIRECRDELLEAALRQILGPEVAAGGNQ